MENIINKPKIKNISILLFVGKKKKYILLLKDRWTNKWMLPGGKIESYDMSYFSAMKREFFEETGYELPYIGCNCQHFIHNNETVIFKGYILKNKKKFIPNEETIEAKYVHINNVLKYNLKEKIKASFINMINNGFI